MKQISVLVLGLLATMSLSASDLVLWYQQPAKHVMNEGLPIGNGRLGALVMGAVEQERLILNENSLWTGDQNPSGNYDSMGAYQALGNVLVDLPATAQASEYRRELDLNRALGRVAYQREGVQYEREFFCSHPAGVLVARFSASKPGCYTGHISVRDAHNAGVVWEGHRMTATGRLSNGLKYEWQLQVLAQGGSIDARDERLELNRW